MDQCVAIAWGLRAEGVGAEGREVARADICAGSHIKEFELLL